MSQDTSVGNLHPSLIVAKTGKFAVYELCELLQNRDGGRTVVIVCKVNCQYSRGVLERATRRRFPGCRLVFCDEVPIRLREMPNVTILQFGDFENIDWEPVMSGAQRASSYLVRKGLSRKAQLALQFKRFLSKHPQSILKRAVPLTLIIETWNAFEDMRINFGGGFSATFDSNDLDIPLREKLELTLEDVKEAMHETGREQWSWILKPSVTNKGADIAMVKNWEGLLDALEDVPDMREWVLQRYVDNPLLINGHKFHLRVYVLCIGALQVYVFDRILALLAAHRYDAQDMSDIYKHLTNTARSAEDVNFEEVKFVKLLDDLPEYLLANYLHKTDGTIESANAIVANIRKQVHEICGQIFSAFENEYTIFSPMSNCFELFGLDFLIDEDLNVSILEVNPGPDFKQTGSRLKTVIEGLFEDTLRLVIDPLMESNGPFSVHHPDNMSLVYDVEWSVARMQGGMKFK